MRCQLAIATIFAVMVMAGQAGAEDGNRGKVLYKAYCSQCHGMEADGYGVNAGYMEIQPKDHTEAKEMNARTDDDLFKAIRDGGKAINKSVLMPAWGKNISEEDIWALVRYLREISATED